ncbi:MAG TPA: hypothetical protein VFJ30_05495 [Phycisphaerae bacterium]|nr:hypothetical protein [Phycisphaerae bacterium]
MAALIQGAGGAAAAELPQWDLTKMAGLDAAQWRAPTTDGTEPCRAVRAGKTGVWTVPAWWGGAPRPAKGTVYVLDIRYKDVLSTPAIFSAHAGLGTYWRQSEIHRFGGLADAQWKTAQVPLSWDLVCKIRGQDNTALSVRSEKEDLPLGLITVRLAGPDDAERYFRETREWIARMDAARFPDVQAVASDKAVLPEAMASQAVVPFVRRYTIPIHQHSAPAAGEPGGPLRIRMTRDELESASFGVYANGRDLKDVSCRLSELTGPAGELNGQVELKTVEYALVKQDRKDGPVVRRVPLRLWPAYSVDIPAGRSHGFWLTVRTQDGKSSPGTYRGKVVIRSGEASAELPVEVEVLPLRLLTVDEAGIAMGACISALPPEQEMQTFQDYNLRTAQTRFHSTNLGFSVHDGRVDIDFGYLDDWMEMAKGKRLAFFRYLMGGNPYGYPDTMTGEKALFAKLHPGPNAQKQFIERHKAFRDNPDAAGVLPEIRPIYAAWVKSLAAHATEKHWPRLAIEPFDEPAKWVHTFVFPDVPKGCLGSGPWIKPHFKDAAKLTREAAKGALVSATVHHAKPGLTFVEDVDLVSTNAIHEDLKLGEKIVGAGKVFWQYTGCNATQPPAIPRYTCGFYFGAFGSTGGVTWAMNFCRGFDVNSSMWWAYSWYTPFGTVTCPAYEGMREGLDDRRLIETCRKQFAGNAESEALLKTILTEAVTARAKGGTDTVNDFYNSPQEVARLDTWRNQLLDELLKPGGGR